MECSVSYHTKDQYPESFMQQPGANYHELACMSEFYRYSMEDARHLILKDMQRKLYKTT